MRPFGFWSMLGVLGVVLLWGSVCQAQGGADLAGWLTVPGASRHSIVPGKTPPLWSYSMLAMDLTRGYDRPWQAKTESLDPDFSAAYAVGGGFKFFLSPTTTFSTSLRFLWRKIDTGGQSASLAQENTSRLGGLNIRAINLVIGVQTRF